MSQNPYCRTCFADLRNIPYCINGTEHPNLKLPIVKFPNIN